MMSSMTSYAFSSSGAGVTMASPSCSKPRAEHGLHIRNNNKSAYKEPTTIQSQKYSHTYNVDLFTCIFFCFSALGAGVASKALVGADFPAAGRVCLSEAITTVTVDCEPAEGTRCPSVALAVPVDRPTVMEGTSCSFTVSSPIVSSTFRLACFGFVELGFNNQVKVENSIKTINGRQQKALARPTKALM
jgi:hypothetical protein